MLVPSFAWIAGEGLSTSGELQILPAPAGVPSLPLTAALGSHGPAPSSRKPGQSKGPRALSSQKPNLTGLGSVSPDVSGRLPSPLPTLSCWALHSDFLHCWSLHCPLRRGRDQGVRVALREPPLSSSLVGALTAVDCLPGAGMRRRE